MDMVSPTATPPWGTQPSSMAWFTSCESLSAAWPNSVLSPDTALTVRILYRNGSPPGGVAPSEGTQSAPPAPRQWAEPGIQGAERAREARQAGSELSARLDITGGNYKLGSFMEFIESNDFNS